MAKLIDLGELVEWLTSPTGFRTNCEDCNSTDCLNCIVEEGIKNQPIVEAAPVVHGRWIGPFRVDASHNGYKCSKCGYFGVPGWVACPKCGAIMDEEVK